VVAIPFWALKWPSTLHEVASLGILGGKDGRCSKKARAEEYDGLEAENKRRGFEWPVATTTAANFG